MHRAKLLVDVKGRYVSFPAFTIGWVKFECRCLWFSDTKDFTNEILIRTSEFEYI